MEEHVNPLGFMHKYYDWAAFETFVKDLYDGDGDVLVERDVTEVDRYGAKRQTDIKITRRSRFHRYITLVECKRWKEPVSRDRIDVLASSIEALNASNGAIFTTTGFEEGAISYAKGKGIDLFVVRDLSDQEWGAPGRRVTIHLHVASGQFDNIRLTAQAVMLVDAPPSNANLAIHLSKEKALDPDFDLFSVKTGERGPNLVSILADVHSMVLEALGNAIGVLEGGRSMTQEIVAPCEVDLSRTEFHQLRLPMAAVRVARIEFQFCARVSQSTIEVDRGKDLDFAVVIESYVSDHRLLAHRKAEVATITFVDLSDSQQDSPPAENALQNGSLLTVCCAPWVGNESAKPDKTGATDQLIKVFVETDGKKPQLSLVAIPLSKTS